MCTWLFTSASQRLCETDDLVKEVKLEEGNVTKPENDNVGFLSFSLGFFCDTELLTQKFGWFRGKLPGWAIT